MPHPSPLAPHGAPQGPAAPTAPPVTVTHHSPPRHRAPSRIPYAPYDPNDPHANPADPATRPPGGGCHRAGEVAGGAGHGGGAGARPRPVQRGSGTGDGAEAGTGAGAGAGVEPEVGAVPGGVGEAAGSRPSSAARTPAWNRESAPSSDIISAT